MNRAEKTEERYEPPKVSRYFTFDWQFAADMSKLPLLRPSSIVIGFMPLITSASQPLFGIQIVKIPPSAWIMWFASLAFLVSWGILKFKCPQIIQHYRDFGEYSKQQHSHRWVVWLFYYNITKLVSWKTIVQETLAKGLSVRISDHRTPEEFRICPFLVKRNSDSVAASFAQPTKEDVHVFFPVQNDRDIYVPIHCGGERLLLLLQEDDPKLKEKEKELFWILFSKAANERTEWRFAFWCFLYSSFALFGINVVKNIVSVAWWMTLGSGV